MTLNLFSLKLIQVFLQITQKCTPNATTKGDGNILRVRRNHGSDFETVPFMSQEDMNKGGHITLKYEQNNAYLQHDHGSPPNAWFRCTGAFGNQISICMQSPTNGL